MTTVSRWPTAVCLASLPLDFAAAVARAAALGFQHVEVVALADRPAEHLEALADAGVLVPSAALGAGLPPGHALDADDVSVRRQTLKQLQSEVNDAARLGASWAWLPAGASPAGPALARFEEGCAWLADHAAARMVRLAVAPAPALPDAEAVLAWLGRVGHANLGLALDLGRAGGDPADLARRAGPRLSHLRLPPGAEPREPGGLASALEEIRYQGVLTCDAPAGPPPARAR
jgi:sugar phosphate isomerase/epimerase